MPFCGKQCSKDKITYLTESFLQNPEKQYINQKKLLLQDVEKMRRRKIKAFFNECQIIIKSKTLQTKLKFFILLLIKDVMNVNENFVVEFFLKYTKQLLFKIAYLPDSKKIVENSQQCLNDYTDFKRLYNQDQKIHHLEYSSKFYFLLIECWQTWQRMYGKKYNEIQKCSQQIQHLFSNIEVYYQYENSNQDFQIMVQNQKKNTETILENQTEDSNSYDQKMKYIDVIQMEENHGSLEQSQNEIKQNKRQNQSGSSHSEDWNIYNGRTSGLQFKKKDSINIQNHNQLQIQEEEQQNIQSGSFTNHKDEKIAQKSETSSNDYEIQNSNQLVKQKVPKLNLDFSEETEDHIDKKILHLSSQTKDMQISIKQKSNHLDLVGSQNDSSSADMFLQAKCQEGNQNHPFSFTNNGSQEIEKFLFTFQKKKLSSERQQNEQYFDDTKQNEVIFQDKNQLINEIPQKDVEQQYNSEQLKKICLKIPETNLEKSFGSDIRTSYNFSVSHKQDLTNEGFKKKGKDFYTENQLSKSTQKKPVQDFGKFYSERLVVKNFNKNKPKTTVQMSSQNQRYTNKKIELKNPPIKIHKPKKSTIIREKQNIMSQQDIIQKQYNYEQYLETEVENLKQNLKRISRPIVEKSYREQFDFDQVQDLRRNSANIQRQNRIIQKEIDQIRSQSRSILEKKDIYKDIVHNYNQLARSLKQKINQQRRQSSDRQQMFIDYKIVLKKREEQQMEILRDKISIQKSIVINSQKQKIPTKKVASLKPIYRLKPQNQNINHNISYQETKPVQKQPILSNKKTIIESDLIKFYKKNEKNNTFLILKTKKQGIKTKLLSQNEKYYKLKKIHNEHKNIYQCIPVKENINGNQIIQIQILQNDQIIKQHFLRINLEPLTT